MKRTSWLLFTILAAGCGAPAPAESPQKLGGNYVFPRYNQVTRKATHNAYWLNNAPGADAEGSGVQERLIDQMLHERVRSFEIDIHTDRGHAGEFSVYHTDSGTLDSQCYYLEDCLALFERFDYTVPDHEVVNIILEFKETAGYRLFGNNGVGGAAKQDHHPQDLDRVLWERLGSRLFTPRELMARCPGAQNMRDCVDPMKFPNAWPTIDELRGRYIVNVVGNWADNYWDWIDYANDDGGVINRAAFPMRSMLTADPTTMECPAFGAIPKEPYSRRGEFTPYAYYNPQYEINTSSLCVNGGHPYIFDKMGDPTFKSRLQTAREASIFWQVEDPTFSRKRDAKGGQTVPAETSDDFLTAGGVARGSDAPFPDNQLDDMVTFGFQELMTDYPFNALFDSQPADATHAIPLPTRANRPFFTLDDVQPGPTRGFSVESMTEPGNRIYLAAGGEASVTLPEGDDQWETQPSATMVTHDDVANPPKPIGAPGGDGCLFARAPNGDELRVCRTATGDAARTVYVDGFAQHGGQQTPFSFKMAQQRYDFGDNGDLLRMRVHRAGGISQVIVWTASVIGPDGVPVWNPLPTGQLIFSSSLSVQGLLATNDMLFVGTLHNGAPATKSDFTSFPSHATDYAYDLGWCLDGACRGPRPAGHDDSFTGLDGGAYVGVHESLGHLYGQDRRLYTTDRFEAQSGGFIQSVWLDKFVLRRDATGGLVPLYRCVDWSYDDHTFWLSRDPACPFDKGPAGRNAGVIGYLSANNANTQLAPLIHYRRGIGNDGPIAYNTYDHQYGLGYQVVPSGWEYVEILGWVYTPTSLVTPPCVPRTTCNAGLTCGESDDGCGNTITCGMCTGTSYCANNRCLVPGTNCKADCLHKFPCDDNSDPVALKWCLSARSDCNTACDCVPQTCAGLGLHCGSAPDGCNHTLDCGGCSTGTTCSSGQCVCVPTVNDCTGRCGNIPNGCGVTLRCPSCTCTPSCVGKRCGQSNGCGGSCSGSCAKVGYYCTDDGTGFKICQRGD